MWFGKNKFAKFAMALAMAVSAVCTTWAADNEVKRDTLYPMYFGNITTGEAPRANYKKQLEEWTYLMKFKMFGATGVEFGNKSIKIPDSVGWFGTASGDFKWGANGESKVGGPIIIGGNMIFDQGPDSVLTGPVRVSGNVDVKRPTNYRGKNNSMVGVHCVGGTAAQEYANFVSDLRGNSNCPDTVPEVKTDLKTPEFFYDGSTINAGLNINGAGCRGDRDSDDFCIYYVDVPEGDKQTPYDYYVESINISNAGKLVFRMQDGGRLTRVFFRYSLSLTSRSKIQIMYMDGEGASWNGTSWTGKGSIVNNEDYSGELLFYTQNDIEFPTFNAGTDTLQGTFISQKKIHVNQHMILAGQLLADYIYVDTYFDGSGFRYVPYNAPEVDITPKKADGGNKMYEGHEVDTVFISLDKKAETSITFDYCFAFEGTDNGGLTEKDTLAVLEDIDTEKYLEKEGVEFPVCGTSKRSASFAIGSTELSKAIVVYVKDDRLPENITKGERFKIKITNLSGARMKSTNSSSGELSLYIIDNDGLLTSADGSSITVTEDEAYTFGEDFPVFDSEGDPWDGDYSITIKTATSGGSLEVDGPVTIGRDMPKCFFNGEKCYGYTLIYTPAENAYGVKYDSLEYWVVFNGLKSEKTYWMYINVRPVNDAPTAHDTVFTINEHVSTADGPVAAKGKVRVEDVDDTKFTYALSTKYDSKYTEAIHDRVLELYEFNEDGTLSAKKDAVLNYESADSLYVVKVVVSDMGGGTSGDDLKIETSEITVTIIINDVNETPTVVKNQVFEVAENSKKGKEVLPEGWKTGDPKNVQATDPDLPDAKNYWGKLTYTIEENDNFVINTSTGLITVKDGADLDYEDNTKNEFTLWVYVTDGGNKKDSAQVTIKVTNVNEMPEIEDDGSDNYVVDENTANKVVIKTWKISDPDGDDDPSNLQVSLADSTTSTDNPRDILATDIFDVQINVDGDVELFVSDNCDLDFEYIKETLDDTVFTVIITLKDDGNATTSIKKHIKVHDLNEQHVALAPEADVDENPKNGTVVDTIKVQDEDKFNADYRKYNFNVVEDDSPFGMKDSLIVVKDSTKLDYETNPKITIHVAVVDKNDPTLTDTVEVVVSLNDINEKPDIIPECDPATGKCSETKCDVALLDCDDPYTPPPATCDSNCGYVDKGNGDKLTVNVRENSKTGYVVFEYVIKDVDSKVGEGIAADTVYFQNTNNSGAKDLFKIEKVQDKTTGEYKMVVTVKDGSKLDYETVKHTHELTLVFADPKNPALQDTVKRTINVIDVNEAPSAEDFKDSIPENSPKGTKVGTLVASDPDTKNTVFGTLTYTIVESGVPFEMKGKDILVKDSTALDYETVPDHKFVFHVKVSDIEYDTTVTVTISLIDKNEKPEIITKCDESDPECNSCDATIKDCDKPTTPPDSTCTEDCGYKDPKSDKIIVNVAENSKTGMVLFEYVIKDQDAGDIEKDSVYFVNVQNKKTGADSLFKVEKVKVGDTYKLVVSVKDGSKLDYEKVEPVHELVLTVSDPKKSDLKDTVIRTINVIDVNEAPVAEDFSESIYENRPKGAKVGSLVASDPDTKNTVFGTLTYTIVESGVPFEMKGKDILVKDSAALNYETVPDHKFVFHVKVSDIEYDTTVTVTITLKDLNEGPKIVTECDPSDPKCKDPGTCDAVFNDCSKPTTPPDSSCTENCGYKNPVNDKVVVNVRENSKTGLVVLEYIIVDEDEGKNGIDADSVYFTNTNKSGADSLFKIEKVKDGDVYKLVVTVKDSSKLDYESTEHLHELTLVVVAKNDPTLVDTVIRTINIVDVNEPPFIRDGNFEIKENLPKGTTVGQVVFGDDKDLKGVSNPAFVNNVVTVIGGDSDKFSVSQGGMISTKTVLDYENDKHDYILVVEVTDRNDPTLSAVDTIRIKLIDVVEQSNVEITKVVTKDSTYKNPDTVYTNQSNITAHWRGGYTLPDQKTTWTVNNDTSTTLVPGRNVIRVEYKDPTANTSVVDSVVIYYSNTLPTVTISANGDAANAHNIYTIVETPDVSDTTIYVNHESNDVVIKIHDPAKEMLGDKKSADTVIVISMELGTAKVDSKTYTNLDKVVKETVALDLDAAADAKRNVKADGKTDVSYTEKVAGIQVTISYTEDKHGDVVKVPVVQDNGKVENIEVIKVSYVTKDQKGNEITVSYYADAYTGVALMSDSQGNLMTSGAASKQEGASSKTSTVGIYNVSYLPTMESKDTLLVSYTVDRKGNLIKNASGDIGYHVSYTYTDACNNSMTSSVFIVLDKVKPEVVILSPANRDIIYSNFTEVIWTVDGVNQDTLTTQGLQPGGNTIVRFFRDKAGNEASDTVFVIMKDGKNVVLSVENPVTEVSKERVDKYYSKNPPSEGQTYAVTVQNPKTGKEVETIKGGSFGTKKGSGKEPYPGLDEDEGHLGPTLVMEVKLPVISGKDGLATLDDILSKDGLYVLKEGIDAASGDIKGVDPLTGEVPDDGKILIADYVREHCVDEVQNSYKPGDDLSKLNLYDTKVNIKLWIYTTIGGFVDYYTFSQDMNNPDYTDETGMSKLFFELKPDINGNVRAEDGRLIATGAYLYKVEASVRAKARCDIPSLTSSNGRKKNDVVKNDDDLLKSFGYKRPTEK